MELKKQMYFASAKLHALRELGIHFNNRYTTELSLYSGSDKGWNGVKPTLNSVTLQFFYEISGMLLGC